MIHRGITSKDTQRHLSIECQSLRDVVEKLRQELLLCKNETQKVKDQLQCLTYLVKRAWSGDYLATLHVSNIVGVGPPDFIKKEPIRANSSPQPDPIANWARLSIGVLNKMYQEEELELRASQLMYLQDREGYLDGELASHSDLVVHQSSMALLKTNTFHLLQEKEEEERKERQARIEQLKEQKQELQLQYRKKHPSLTHLYKTPSRETIKQETELCPDESLFAVKSVGTSRPSSGVKKKQHGNKTMKKQEHDDFSDEYEDEAHAAAMIHNLSSTSHGPTTKPRAKSAASPQKARTATARSRPLSAKPKSTWTSTTNSRNKIDLIERDLKMTTKTLQDRLGRGRGILPAIRSEAMFLGFLAKWHSQIY